MVRIYDSEVDFKEPYHVCRLLTPVQSKYRNNNSRARIYDNLRYNKNFKAKSNLRKQQHLNLKELSFEKLMFGMRKAQGEIFVGTVKKGEGMNLKYVNPWINIFELRQLVYLISQLHSVRSHKMYFCVQDKRMMEFLGRFILQKFPSISHKIVLSNATRMHEALEYMQPMHPLGGIVFFIGDMPSNIYEFFLKKNFLFLNSLALVDIRTCGVFDRYFLSIDGKNINSLIWFLALITKVYDQLKLGKLAPIECELPNMYEEISFQKLQLLPIGALTYEERVSQGGWRTDKKFNNGNPHFRVTTPSEDGVAHQHSTDSYTPNNKRNSSYTKQDYALDKHQALRSDDKRYLNQKARGNLSTSKGINIEPKHEK